MARRQARMDPSPPNLFEQLDKLRSFVEVCSLSSPKSAVFNALPPYKYFGVCVCVCVGVLQVVSDGTPLVQAVVPKNQTRSIIIQGSDVLVRSPPTPVAWLW